MTAARITQSSITTDVGGTGVQRPGSLLLASAIFAVSVLLVAEPGQGQFDFELQLGGALTNGQNGVNGFDGVDSLTLSPDGHFIYAASCRNDSIGVIQVDIDTGALNNIQVLFNGDGGIELDCPVSPLVSPDGVNLYVSGHLSNTIGEFAINPNSRRLKHRHTYREQDGVPDRPLDLGSPANGEAVTVGSWTENSVTVFQRNIRPQEPNLSNEVVIGLAQPVKPAAFPRGLSDTVDDLAHMLIQGTFPGDISVVDLGSRESYITGETSTGCSGMQETGIIQLDEFFDPEDSGGVFDPDDPADDTRLATAVTNGNCGIFETSFFGDFNGNVFGNFHLGEPVRVAGTPTTDHLTIVNRAIVGVNNGSGAWILNRADQTFIAQDLKKTTDELGHISDLAGSSGGGGSDEQGPNQGSPRMNAGEDGNALSRLRVYATHPSTSSVSAWNLNITCKTGGEQLCLGDGRYYVAAKWRTKKKSGRAQAVQLTEDTGYFWFFDKDNVEVVLKVHDGCGFNDRQWVFAGGLTDVEVEIRVEDLLTGEIQDYGNKLGRAFQPVRDIEAFNGCLDVPDARIAGSTGDSRAVGALVESTGWSAAIDIAPRELGATVIPRATCKASDTTLCINQDRFAVEVDWATKKQSGAGHAKNITPDTGYFWFFDKSNIEMVIKVFNGCGNNDHFWVFAGGLTDVDVDITVTDSMTGRKFEAHNPLGSAFRPIRNITSFPCS